MEMTNEQIQQASKVIKSLTEKACATLRAKKLKLTEKQKEVLAEIINDKNSTALNCRTYKSLLKKGFIIHKPNQNNLIDESHYLINF